MKPHELASWAIDWILGMTMIILMTMFSVHLVLQMFHYWFK